MALLSPTFVIGVLVLLYLSSFVVFAIIRIVTGLSIQRLGYFSLRRLAYTPRDGFKIEIRGLGLNIHRPTFSQPTWLSIVVNELVVTVDIAKLGASRAIGINQDDGTDSRRAHGPNGQSSHAEKPPNTPTIRREGGGSGRSKAWKQLTHIKERIKRLHREVKWLRMVDVVATNTTINVVDVGNIQVGSFTVAVDTRRKMIGRARFFLQSRADRKRQKQQAEWIVTLRSALFTADGKDSLEILDAATLNVHGFLYDALDGLRDASVALKLGRVHIPYDDIRHSASRYETIIANAKQAPAESESLEVVVDQVMQELDVPGSTNEDLMQTVSDSKEFVSSILRGIKEVQFAVSFVGFTKKIEGVQTSDQPVILNASIKEIGIDLHRLDSKSPAHRMYFPPKDIAHEALAAALSISIGVDDGHGKLDRLMYIPMATTTVRTTLPSKTVELSEEGTAEERNANILFANSVVTSPSVDLDPRHLPLLLAMLRPRPQSHKSQPQQGHMLLSRLLPKANVKFTMHEPVIRITLPPVEKPAEPDEFDLIISSISSVSMDLESFHSAVEEMHYSLASTMRVQTHNLYYQTSSGNRFDLLDTESFELKVQLNASPDVQVVATGSLQTFSLKMVRQEIGDGLRQIIRQLRLDVEPDKPASLKSAKHTNFLRAMPPWLLRFHMQFSDFSVEVAGVDEGISPDVRGVALQWESLSAEYRAQRLEGVQQTSRRRASSRGNLTPDSELLKAVPVSPRKKHHREGDGRRIAIHVRGFEAFMVESSEKWELEPFINVPRFEVAFSTTSDSQGPVFHVHSHVRTLLVQYSLYRHYAVGVAIMVIRKAFMWSSKDAGEPGTPRPSRSPTESKLAAAGHLSPPPRDQPNFSLLEDDPSKPVRELTTIDFKATLVQIKADMPADPALMLHIYNVEAGRHRWSPPFVHAKLIRLYAEAPRMRRVWARMISIKNGRVDYRESKRKLSSGGYQEERMLDVVTEATRIAVPHEMVVHKISDNCMNVFKSVKQLHHRFKTGTDEDILVKVPEGPKHVPKISIRSRAFMFELEDGAFEWKLGMIYRAGRIEQMQRQAREDAFRLKVKKIHEEEARRATGKFRARSVRPRGRSLTADTPHARSFSAEGQPRLSIEAHSRGRAPRYDPESDCLGMSGAARISIGEARHNLNLHNARSWKQRIDRHYSMTTNNMKDLRGLFWGRDEIPNELDDNESILEVPERPALMSTLIQDLHFVIDKPSFPMKDLPDFLFKVGKGMPKDTKYSLLVPMNIQINMAEAKMSLRDYPLPLLHVPKLKAGQSHRLSALSLKTNFVIAEEFRGSESMRRVKVQIVPPRNPGSSNEGSFAIDVRRTIGPVKSYSDMYIDINTANPTRVTWGPSYQPAIQDMMMAIESLTKPQLDPSERVGFWDKIRLNLHSRVRIAWREDGDVHLALKGTRDPYQVTGNGAGFLMCWRNDVRWNIHADDDPKRFMSVDSGEYVLAIPDYSHEARESRRQSSEEESVTSSSNRKSGASFRKVVMKLSGKVQWLAGLVFERAIEDGSRNFKFKPHYDVVLKTPQYAQPQNDLPYDAFRGFRSQHIHLSIAVRAPVDREWSSSNMEPSRSYNTVHLTPRFFTHFFAWWSLFSGPLSLPIRQGSLWPGREKNSKKFGRHLATIKYNLLLAPLFLSHIYKHKDPEDHSDNAVSATGIKVRFDSWMLDLHQRREEFNTRDRGRNTQSRTSGMKIHAAQLDLNSADIRAVSATIRGTTAEAMKRNSFAAYVTDQDDDVTDLSRFTIPDNDLSWIDMDDFVELDWILPTEPNPDTRILPLVYAPRITYFRQTDIGGVIAGDPDRSSPFGQEPTHLCIMSQDDDPRRFQAQLIRQRLEQLQHQIEEHERMSGQMELHIIREDHEDPDIRTKFDALNKHTSVLMEKKAFMETMLRQMAHGSPDGSKNGDSTGGEQSSESIDLGDGTLTIPSAAEFASDFKNRFVVHNMQLKWNNTLRNIILRYIHQVSQRRGFVYYLSRPAVKFILDIVEEQAKSKASRGVNSGSSARAANSPDFNATDQEIEKDIENRIRKILQDGKKFVNADEDPGPDSVHNVAMADLSSGIADGFTPQKSYHVRLIAPQIQLQSEKNKKHVVLIASKGMELKVVEVLDTERLSDNVSGLVQRRFLVNMDSTQFFVSHQKWFSPQLIPMYSGSPYGSPAGAMWPPWVPMEVMYDFHSDPFGFKRVVQKTSAMLRYDKYNTLRLKYNDEVNMDEGTSVTSHDSTESRMDNLWVDFPQLRALCNSSQYSAIYVIVLDLLMYSEPLEKTRSERLEKIMLASDFSDLRGTPEMVIKLQERIRQLEDIKTHFQVHSKYLDDKGWNDRLLLERDLAACEDELFFMMKAITTSQRKFDTTATSALLKWSITAKEIVWQLIRDGNEPLVELQLKNVEYDRTDNSDGSHMNLIQVGKILGLNLLADAIYPTMVAPYAEKDKELPDTGGQPMIRVYWNMLEAIAGIPVMDHFEVNLFPMKIQLEREVGTKLFEYIFPGLEGEKSNANANANGKSEMPPAPKVGDIEDDGDGDSLSFETTDKDKDKDAASFTTRAGSLELRLRPTLTSDQKSRVGKMKALSLHSGEGNSFRLFRTGSGFKSMSKKASFESLRGSGIPRPGVGRSSTGFSSRDTGSNTESKKGSRFVLRKNHGGDEKTRQSDDLTKMIDRASNYMTFAYIKIPSVVLSLSYKGKGDRNLKDVHDFVFRLPTMEFRNKTWSNLDLALALKGRVIKALISHTGAIIGNKFSKHRPNTAQQTKLRELATSSVLLTPQFSETLDNSDDSSSILGTSPGDFSHSPPRSLYGSASGSLIPRPTSAVGHRPSISPPNRSYSSHAVLNTTAGGGGSVPTFMMMTPPTPLENVGAEADLPPLQPPNNNHHQSRGLGISLLRPMSSHSLYNSSNGSNTSNIPRPTSSSNNPKLGMDDNDRGGQPDRKRLGGASGAYFRDKFSALTNRLKEGTSGQSITPPVEDEEAGDDSASGNGMPLGRRLSRTPRGKMG